MNAFPENVINFRYNTISKDKTKVKYCLNLINTSTSNISIILFASSYLLFKLEAFSFLLPLLSNRPDMLFL